MFKKALVTALAATALTVPHASAEETCTIESGSLNWDDSTFRISEMYFSCSAEAAIVYESKRDFVHISRWGKIRASTFARSSVMNGFSSMRFAASICA